MMFSVKAVSWDTQPRLPYNRNAPRNPNKKPESETDSVSLKTHPQTVSLAVESVQTKSIHVPVTELLKKSRVSYQVNSDNSYHGYEQWLPSPPKVEKPRSLYNAALLAYIGDCIYEFYARRHFLFPPLSIEEHNDRVTAIVRCEAQDELLQKLLADNYLSEEERDVLRWGKNVGAGKSRSKKRVGAAIYNRASSLETLIGYLYLTNVKRLEDVMLKLGFSTGAPVESVQGENYFSTSCCACSSLSYSYVLNQMLKIENKQTVYYVVPVRKDLLLSWSSLHYKGDMRLFWPACSTRKVKLNLV